LEKSNSEKNGKRNSNLELKLLHPKKANWINRLPRSSQNKKNGRKNPRMKASLMEYKPLVISKILNCYPQTLQQK